MDSAPREAINLIVLVLQQTNVLNKSKKNHLKIISIGQERYVSKDKIMLSSTVSVTIW
jgi:hypothetical protein